MTGYYVIAREAWDHPLFKAEPFTELQAWFWMIGEASWCDKSVRVNNRAVIELKRGQFVHARRYLASVWRWDESKVRRFLEKLVKAGNIDRLPTAEATIITICNYDKYQLTRPANDPPTDQPATSPRPKEEELKKIKTDVDEVARPLVSDSAFEIATELGKVCGFKEPLDWPPAWCGAPMRVQTWLNSGWQRDEILTASREAVGKKRDGPPSSINYFEKPIASFRAKQSAPVPKVEIVKQEVVHVVQGAGQSNSAIIGAADKLIQGGVRFAPKPSMFPGNSGAASENVVRLLPQGGCERSGDLHGGDHGGSGGVPGGSGDTRHRPEDGPASEVELPSDCG